MAFARPAVLVLTFLLVSCSTPMKQTPAVADVSALSIPPPPVAAKKPHQVPSPHGNREDEYYWLRDDKRENPEMLAYVKAENEYADRMLAHTKTLESRVYGEIIGRIQQDDSTVPYLMNGYWYYRRYETGRKKHPRKSCSTSTKWRRVTISSRSGISPSVRTAISWPGPKTRWDAASTWCA